MRHLVEKHCGGRTITKVIAADDSKVFADGCSPKMVTALTNRKLVGAVRKGKWLLLEFQSENLKCTVALHCGMTGSLVVRGVPAFQYKEFVVHDEVWPPRFCKLELEFGGVSLAFTDPRRFGRIHLVDDPGAFAPVVALGWDMLTAPPTLEQFSQGLAKRSGPIKGVLLDQSFTAGVGNYIADEGLYQARLHPAHPANQLTPEQQSTLLKQLVHVIATASAVGADAGRFPSDWLFHFRLSAMSCSIFTCSHLSLCLSLSRPSNDRLSLSYFLSRPLSPCPLIPADGRRGRKRPRTRAVTSSPLRPLPDEPPRSSPPCRNAPPPTRQVARDKTRPTRRGQRRARERARQLFRGVHSCLCHAFAEK